ncbi:MAG: hypothetical protein H6828_12235 [Planctomycetes bacterium]|nr:hypothetical protein [Planctomycetota bacterium]
MSSTTARLAFALAALPLLPACRDEPVAAPEAPQVVISNGVASVQGSGFAIEFDDGVSYQSELVVSNTEHRQTQTVNGLAFEVEAGGFRLGGARFDVPDGARVRFAPDGIWVDDERRWDLPK